MKNIQIQLFLLAVAGILCFYGYYLHQDIYNNVSWLSKKISVNNKETESFYHKTHNLRKKAEKGVDFANQQTSIKNASLKKSHSAMDTHNLEAINSSESKHYNTYRQTFPALINLENIKQSENNIFFIETSCGTDSLLKTYKLSTGINLNPRQCCAVESAALTNRNHNVYILYTCPIDMKVYEKSPEYVKQMLTYQNVFLISLKLDEFFQRTPVESLYYSSKIKSSLYPVEHLSDVLRFLTLWKFGGTYLDSDTITVRCLDTLKYNYAGLEDNFNVGSAILNFKFDGIGHDILTDILRELSVSFDGSEWGANGPHLITRMLLKECNFDKLQQLTRENCYAFTIYAMEYFYPVHYNNLDSLFGEMASDELSKTFSDSYVIHFWNKLSKNKNVKVGSNQVYGILADGYCPGVYHNCGTYF